jgi:hypothetical protein
MCYRSPPKCCIAKESTKQLNIKRIKRRKKRQGQRRGRVGDA